MAQTPVSDNWPRDADDLVNGIPETVKAAKTMGHVPAAGNDPEAQLRVGKQLAGLGIEVPDGMDLQTTAITPADRRAAVQRQNEYAGEVAGVLENAEGWNPVKHAAAVERGEDPADAARKDGSDGRSASERAAEERKAAGVKATAAPVGRSTVPKSATT